MKELELRELVEKIQKQKIETQRIELESAHEGCPKRLYDSLSAFSNQDGGGMLIFGIDVMSSFSIVGVYDPHDL